MSEVIIRDIQDFLNLKHDFLNENDEIWYRGQANFERGLVPSFLRLQNHDKLSEQTIQDIFIQNASTLIETPSNPFDWMFIMQHYGIPTRLLDWTENPLVALYFAVEKYKKEKDGTLWLLKPKKLNKLSISSENTPLYNDDQIKQHMSGQSVHQKKPAAILASRNTSRIKSQEGVFTIHLDNGESIDKDYETYLLKIKIPHNFKGDISNQLQKLGINEFRLFPELSYIKTIMNQKGLLK